MSAVRAIKVANLGTCTRPHHVRPQPSGKEFCFKEELLLKETSNRESQMAEVYRGWSLEELTNAQVLAPALLPYLCPRCSVTDQAGQDPGTHLLLTPPLCVWGPGTLPQPHPMSGLMGLARMEGGTHPHLQGYSVEPNPV